MVAAPILSDLIALKKMNLMETTSSLVNPNAGVASIAIKNNMINFIFQRLFFE